LEGLNYFFRVTESPALDVKGWAGAKKDGIRPILPVMSVFKFEDESISLSLEHEYSESCRWRFGLYSDEVGDGN